MVKIFLQEIPEEKVGIFPTLSQPYFVKKYAFSAVAEERQPAAARCGGLHRPACSLRHILRRPRTDKRREEHIFPIICTRSSHRPPRRPSQDDRKCHSGQGERRAEIIDRNAAVPAPCNPVPQRPACNDFPFRTNCCPKHRFLTKNHSLLGNFHYF